MNHEETTDAKLTMLMEQNKNTFTKSEQKLHQYIMERFEDVLYQSLTEISIECKLGEATVLRFCRKLGFKGYQDFKFALAQELSSLQKTNNEETYIDKVRSNMTRVIEDTHELLDPDSLQEAIEKISNADEVIAYGISSSGIAGLDMQNRLMRIGKNIEVVTDSHNQVFRSVSVTRKTVIIAISLTGSTKDIVDAVQEAKKNHATVIAITNYVKSPLTKYSDLALLTSAKENPLDSGSLVSKVSQLFVIDLLCTGIAMTQYGNAQQNKAFIARAISSKLY
ncbi:MurR/RpiR family transcriptional regulator [Natribacillus halophilus]|uniref:DNA-binding transcriptional regulator, MurR/RpiR family, contains HTH and SIS domains n=1 Tax=Natribacillus halophilus TaxID=549003 RepID=A0A1G8QNZ6_9BACI|nr:MurR/RpiR family transcriptional regulator [Natribacillus halophilus]SDJ06474.1 DNA-binding transcriptional regulator, MurR/RpiR family, contains HTH and SIS domains [Natribacillus halophilus]